MTTLTGVALLYCLQRSHLGPKRLHTEVAVGRTLAIKIDLKFCKQKRYVVHDSGDVTQR